MAPALTTGATITMIFLIVIELLFLTNGIALWSLSDGFGLVWLLAFINLTNAGFLGGIFIISIVGYLRK